jgi:hypothetical protein
LRPICAARSSRGNALAVTFPVRVDFVGCSPRSCTTGRSLGSRIAVCVVDVDVCNDSWKAAVSDIVSQRSPKNLIMCLETVLLQPTRCLGLCGRTRVGCAVWRPSQNVSPVWKKEAMERNGSQKAGDSMLRPTSTHAHYNGGCNSSSSTFASARVTSTFGCTTRPQRQSPNVTQSQSSHAHPIENHTVPHAALTTDQRSHSCKPRWLVDG